MRTTIDDRLHLKRRMREKREEISLKIMSKKCGSFTLIVNDFVLLNKEGTLCVLIYTENTFQKRSNTMCEENSPKRSLICYTLTT